VLSTSPVVSLKGEGRIEEVVASVAAQGGVAIKEEWAKEVKKKWAQRDGMFQSLEEGA
jgi:hypothetical protein